MVLSGDVQYHAYIIKKRYFLPLFHLSSQLDYNIIYSIAISNQQQVTKKRMIRRTNENV